MHLRSSKKLNSEVHLSDTIGKDKDDNNITLQDILENDEKNIEDEIDLKFKCQALQKKMQDVLTSRERLILELRYGLNEKNPKTQNEIADMLKISRSYVSRIQTKAIHKLSKVIDK